MNIEEELRKIKFSNLSRVREELLRRMLNERKIKQVTDMELGMEELDSVSAAKKNEMMKDKQT